MSAAFAFCRFLQPGTWRGSASSGDYLPAAAIPEVCARIRYAFRELSAECRRGRGHAGGFTGLCRQIIRRHDVPLSVIPTLCTFGFMGSASRGRGAPYRYDSYTLSLVGLLAAALGISRDNEEELNQFNQHYRFAILPLSSHEQWLRDYHTTQVPRENKNGVTLPEEKN